MIFNMVGGAGGGKDGAATLTVTAPTNTNVIVSKDTKSYTKNSGSTGVAVFQGLTTGQWTVSISNGQQTQTRTINITTTYSIVIAFFAATINITYPAGSTCTVTKGSTVFTAPDTSGTWGCVVPSTGTWVVACTDGALTSSQNVSITADGQTESITLAYFTATINITYPATSTCTVTNSSGATIATDTNTATSTKTFVATVHGVGVYTITATATDGSGKSKSQSVEITSEGQSVSVKLAYELVLFDNGDNTIVTGGWKGTGVTPTVSNVLSFSITNIDATFPKAASVYAENKIDLSKYNKLTVIKSEANGWHIGVAENKFSWGVYPPGVADIGFIAYADLDTSDTHIELDISGINTECYVATYKRANSLNPEVGAKTYSATLTNITLS